MAIVDRRPEHNLHPEGLTPGRERLARELFDIQVVRLGDFRLKVHDRFPNAPLSPVYVDLRSLRSVPHAKRMAVEVYGEVLGPLSFSLLADVPTAATPLVSSLSDRINIGMITPRSDNKSYGSGAKVDGRFEHHKGMRVALIDDLITDGGSKIEAASTLRDEGYVVEDVIVLIDREQGGEGELRRHGLDLHAAMTISQMLDYYVRIGQITPGAREHVQRRLDTLNEFLEAQKNK